MILPFQEYDLKISIIAGKASYSLMNIVGYNTFTDFSAEDGCKCYMVADDDVGGSVVYVGMTTRSMKSRFAGGFGKTNKKGTYSWVTERSHCRLLVWDLSQIASARRELEIIEAEVTFAVRVMQRWWPVSQNSITFGYFQTSTAAKVASIIARNMIHQYFGVLIDRKTISIEDKKFLEGHQRKTDELLKNLQIWR